MKKTVQLLIFTLFSSVILGQDIKDSTHKWSIGVAGSLNYSRFDYVKSYFNNQVDNVFILTPGINLFVKKELSKKISFEFGVKYYTLKNKIFYIDDFETDMESTSFKFLSLPTAISFDFGKRRLNFSVVGGIDWTFLADTKHIYKKEGYPETITQNSFPKGQFSPYAKVGFQVNYQLTKNTEVFLQIQGNLNMLPFIKTVEMYGPDAVYEKTIHFMRLPIGITYQL